MLSSSSPSVPETFRVWLHHSGGGGGGGGPQIGEVICGGPPHLQVSCKRDQIKMRDYMDKRVTPPKLATQTRKKQFDNREQDLLAQSEGFGDFKGLTRFR